MDDQERIAWRKLCSDARAYGDVLGRIMRKTLIAENQETAFVLDTRLLKRTDASRNECPYHGQLRLFCDPRDYDGLVSYLHHAVALMSDSNYAYKHPVVALDYEIMPFEDPDETDKAWERDVFHDMRSYQKQLLARVHELLEHQDIPANDLFELKVSTGHDLVTVPEYEDGTPVDIHKLPPDEITPDMTQATCRVSFECHPRHHDTIANAIYCAMDDIRLRKVGEGTLSHFPTYAIWYDNSDCTPN